MAYEKRIYKRSDLVSVNTNSAPSLDIPALSIDGFYMPKDGGKLMVFYASVKKGWVPDGGCPVCKKTDKLIRSGTTKPRQIRDVMRNNYNIIIVLQPARMECTRCKQRFTPAIDGIVEGRSMTQRLLDFVKEESFLQPHVALESMTGLSIQTIQNIMDEEIDRYDKFRAENPLEAPRVLGIDEKHITSKMRGTIVDVGNGNLLDMLEDNSEKTMTAAIMRLKDWDKNIKVVTTDMSNRYIRWLPELLPEATIVVDKFHVIQDLQNKITKTRASLYTFRKKIIEGITDPEEKIRQTNILKIVNDNRRLFNYSINSVEREMAWCVR